MKEGGREGEREKGREERNTAEGPGIWTQTHGVVSAGANYACPPSLTCSQCCWGSDMSFSGRLSVFTICVPPATFINTQENLRSYLPFPLPLQLRKPRLTGPVTHTRRAFLSDRVGTGSQSSVPASHPHRCKWSGLGIWLCPDSLHLPADQGSVLVRLGHWRLLLHLSRPKLSTDSRTGPRLSKWS